MNQQDMLKIPYYAEKVGTYSFTVQYRSGDPQNAISWAEENNKITAGSVVAGADDSAEATHQVTFEVEVTEPGAGTLVFTGPDNKSPQLDKFDIAITAETGEVSVPDTYKIVASAGEGGTISPSGEVTANSGESQAFTITPDEGWHISDVNVNGESVGAVASYVMNAAGTIEAVFEEDVAEPERHEVTLEGTENGSIIVIGGTGQDGTVVDGNTLTYSVQTEEGYAIDTLAVNGEAVAEAAGLEIYEGKVENVITDVTISAVFKEKAKEPSVPDKRGLESTLKDAEAILADEEKYTAESLEKYKAEVEKAQTVLEDGERTQTEIDEAVQNLKDAKALLKESVTDKSSEPSTDKPRFNTDKPDTKPNYSKEAVKTGDKANPVLWIAALGATLAAGSTVVVRKKRK